MKHLGLIVALFGVCLVETLPAVDLGQTPPPKEPLSVWSKQWLEEVVPYIITAAERSVFLSLPNEAERGKFIQNFWDKKDPNRETPENEFKIAYYKRIALANKFFGTGGIAGWKTDRGKIFILLGPPQEIQRDFNASSDILSSNVSREIWNYWNLPNPKLPYNLEVAFVDKFNTGHFMLESGVVPTPGGSTPFDINSMTYAFDQMELAADAMKNPFENSRKLQELITTQVTYNLIPLRYEAFCFKGTENSDYIPFTIEIPYSKLTPKIIEKKYYYSLTMMVSLSNPLGQSLFQKIQDINFDHPPEDIPRLENTTRLIQMALDWEPGDYKIHLLVLDNFSGKIGSSHQDLSLANYAASGLTCSDIILSQEIETLSAKENVSRPRPYLHPAKLDRIFTSGRDLDLYFEVYNVSLNPETGLNSLTVEYVLLRDGRVLAQVPSPAIKPSSQKDCRVETSLKLKNLKPGEYALKINVTDEIMKRSISKEINFRIIE